MAEMTFLLLVLAVTAAVPIFSALAVRYGKKHPPKNYDERQEIARGKAFEVGAGIMLIYFLALFVVYGWQGMVHDTQVSAMQITLAIFAGLELSLLVVHTYCILTHAALPLNKRPQGMMVSYLFLGVVDLLNYYLRCWRYPDYGNALEGYLYLMIGVGACYLSMLYLIEWLRRRKEARDGEE